MAWGRGGTAEIVNVGVGTAPVWLFLFTLVQSTDVLTTAVARSRGAVEVMPVSASLLHEGGPVWLLILKLVTVLAIGCALLLAINWVRRGRPGSVVVYRLVLLATQAATVTMALVSLQNAVLAHSI